MKISRQVIHTIVVDPTSLEIRFDSQGVMHAFFSTLDSTAGWIFEIIGDMECERLTNLIDEAKEQLRYPTPIRVMGTSTTMKTIQGSRTRVNVDEWGPA